jgi:hypothetical protein
LYQVESQATDVYTDHSLQAQIVNRRQRSRIPSHLHTLSHHSQYAIVAHFQWRPSCLQRWNCDHNSSASATSSRTALPRIYCRAAPQFCNAFAPAMERICKSTRAFRPPLNASINQLSSFRVRSRIPLAFSPWLCTLRPRHLETSLRDVSQGTLYQVTMILYSRADPRFLARGSGTGSPHSIH